MTGNVRVQASPKQPMDVQPAGRDVTAVFRVTERRKEPPQYELGEPKQKVLQDELDVVEVAERTLPHQHSLPFSVPE